MSAYRLTAVFLLAAATVTGGCSKSDSNSESGDIPEFSAFKDISDAPQVIQTAAQAVVRIQTADSYATGSFISGDGLLLTNNHVLGVDVCPREGCYAKITRMHQRHETPRAAETIFVVPQHIDVGLDMAILQAYTLDGYGRGTQQRLSTPQYLTLSPRDSASLIGTHVNVVGHPEGKLKKWTSGDVAQATGTWFKSTAFILPGNSGSPLLDDDGKVVGLLHRGPTSQDLVTRTGINVYSLGTASAAIVNAMNAPLPEATRSLTAPATEADIVEHQIVYMNAHVSTATVSDLSPATPPQDASRGMLSLLGTACDKGLARTDYDSPEDLAGALQPCYDGLNWIECQIEAQPDGYHVCPDPEGKTAWATRFQGVFDHYRALNGQLDLDVLTFGTLALQSAPTQGNVLVRAKLQVVLSEVRPPLDFSLSLYLAIFGIDSYGGTTMVDYVRNYSKSTHYELSITNIALTALWLNDGSKLSIDETKNLISTLATDDKASLGQKLYLEEVRYNSNFLDAQ